MILHHYFLLLLFILFNFVISDRGNVSSVFFYHKFIFLNFTLFSFKNFEFVSAAAVTAATVLMAHFNNLTLTGLKLRDEREEGKTFVLMCHLSPLLIDTCLHTSPSKARRDRKP